MAFFLVSTNSRQFYAAMYEWLTCQVRSLYLVDAESEQTFHFTVDLIGFDTLQNNTRTYNVTNAIVLTGRVI
jgi:hypothetical protein